VRWQPIIAGVDGSPESLRAASLAWRIAKAADTRCLLVHAVPDVWAPAGVAPLVNSAEVFDLLVTGLRQLLARELRAEVPESIRHALIARPGRPTVVLEEVARDIGAGLIVVGGRRHGALARGFGGSTAHNLVRTSAIPVLVAEAASRTPVRVLAATDFSAAASPTLSTAMRYADLLDGQLGIVHAVEFGAASATIPLTLNISLLESRSRDELERLVELEGVSIAPDDRLLRRGRADEEIAEAAAAWHADLLVVGSHGSGWIDRLLIGSTTERLLNRLPTSLLVVPMKTPAARRPARQRETPARRGRRRKGMVIL
jgi:nucleotide-binding universal stress UspA family protein